MHFNSALISSLLFVSAVLTVGRDDTGAPNRFPRRPENHTAASRRLTSSDIWSGAICKRTNGTFNSVAGTFTVPRPKENNDKNSRALFGVAIDRTSCGDSWLQAGIYLEFVDDNKPAYHAWYSFAPSQVIVPNFTVSAGDDVKLNVTAVTPTTGLVIIENLTNNNCARIPVDSDSLLCGGDAGWIVDASYQEPNVPYPFAKFEDATFTDVVASGPYGDYTPADASIGVLEYGNQSLTSVSANETSVRIHRL